MSEPDEILDAPSSPAAEALRAMVSRADTFLNNALSIGNKADPNSAWHLGPTRSHASGKEEQHSRLRRQNVYARRIAEELPRDALRGDITVEHADFPDLNDAVQAHFKRHKFKQKLREALASAREHGDAWLMLVTSDGLDPREPLDLWMPFEVMQVHVLHKPEVTPVSWGRRTPFDERLDEAEIYQVNMHMHAGTWSSRVHRSRLIRVPGVDIGRYERSRNGGYNDSVYVSAGGHITRMSTFEQIAHGLAKNLKTTVYKASLKKRSPRQAGNNGQTLGQSLAAKAGNLIRQLSINNIAVVGDDEEVSTDSLTLSGVGEIGESLVQGLAAAADGMSLTKLVGVSPGGLSTDDMAGTRNWNLRQADLQADVCEPVVYDFVLILCASLDGPTGGRIPAGLRVVFAALDEPTEAERLDAQDKLAEIDRKTIELGVPRHIVLRHRYSATGYNLEPLTLTDEELAALEPEDDDGLEAEAPMSGVQGDIMVQIAERMGDSVTLVAGVGMIARLLSAPRSQVMEMLGLTEQDMVSEDDNLIGSSVDPLASVDAGVYGSDPTTGTNPGTTDDA